MGSLLFLLHINDIAQIPRTLSMAMCAYDTNIFFSGSNLHSVASEANTWLAELSKWVTANKIELNVRNTEFSVFREKKNKIIKSEPIIRLRNCPISRLDSVRLRIHCVVFNENLAWSDRVNHVRSKVSSSVGILYKIKKKLLPLWFKKQIYHTLVQ